ncbi:MAG: RNA degradosome polyphosphate kinase, partial [Gemmatimonadales bacterium]
GVHVSYGVTGLKTHSKTLLVIRREGSAIRRYVHISTGNYNAKTARLYTDFGLFSADPDLGADLTDLFNVLTGFAANREYRKLIVAPYGMRERFVEMIRRESAHARAGEPARIMAKMNSLVDPGIIAELYMASCAGVSVDLIVRGICCLRPGLRGISQNIRVISIIGRFLEHSRAFYFRNGGVEEVFIGSADWMPRNLDRRIEAVTPVESPKYRRLLRDMLDEMWKDNRQAWDLRSDGTYVQRTPPDRASEHATHRMLLEIYQERNTPDGCAPPDEKPAQ